VPWLIALLLLVAAAAAAWYIYSQVRSELNEARPIAVPEVLGLPEELARQQLERLGFEVESERESSSEFRAGRVAEQNPDAGTRLPRGETVTIIVSTGPPRTEVPRVVGLSFEEAVAELSRAGLRAERTEVFSARPTGEVVRQNPAPGADVVEGSVVQLRVSKGTETVAVPDVLLQNQASATAELETAGFDVSVSTAPSDDVEEGLVASQDPEPGTDAPKGSTVSIVVSEGPESATVPGVRGQDAETAQSTLEDAGFGVQVEEQETNDPTLENIVLDQNPAGGVRAEPGSTVTITVGRFAPLERVGPGEEG
jgi:serine/threonine-protein kinase